MSGEFGKSSVLSGAPNSSLTMDSGPPRDSGPDDISVGPPRDSGPDDRSVRPPRDSGPRPGDRSVGPPRDSGPRPGSGDRSVTLAIDSESGPGDISVGRRDSGPRPGPGDSSGDSSKGGGSDKLDVWSVSIIFRISSVPSSGIERGSDFCSRSRTSFALSCIF